jgi:hypothetical protein
MRFQVLFTFVLLPIATAAVAQNPERVTVTTSSQNGATRGTVSPSTLTDVGAEGALITIDCTATNNCNKLDATLDNQSRTISDVSGTAGSIKLKQADVSTSGSTVLILDGNTPIASVRLRSVKSPSTTSSSSNSAANSAGCSTLPSTYEPELDRNGKPKLGADARSDAHFVVTSGGSILQYPDQPVDENDRVFVHVQGTPDEVPNIEVARTSPTRIPGAHFVGEGTTINLKAKERCTERVFELGDFAAGEGAVEVYTVATGQKVSRGAFKFTVDTLYSGIIGFGPMFTRGIGDETFKLQARGDKKVITASAEGVRNVIYAVSYTYFMWGRRDLEKPEMRWFTHVNPTLGISVNNMSDHALVGASIDLGQLLITVGSHVAHVTRLNSKSGLSDGSEFPGTADDIPTSKRWESHAFIGVSVDIRAAAALLKTLATGGGS